MTARTEVSVDVPSWPDLRDAYIAWLCKDAGSITAMEKQTGMSNRTLRIHLRRLGFRRGKPPAEFPAKIATLVEQMPAMIAAGGFAGVVHVLAETGDADPE